MGTARLPIQMVPLKDFEETKLKLKILEGKRAEDRERLKDYEKLKNEVEQLQLTKSKLSGIIIPAYMYKLI
jgi:dynactin 1